MNTPNERVCALWGTPAESGRNQGFQWDFDSPRAGGCYSLDLLAFNQLPQNDLEIRAKLTTWLVDQRRAGEAWPLITSEVIHRVADLPTLTMAERIDRFFLYLVSRRLRPGATLDFSGHPTIDFIAAWTESETNDEAVALILILHEMALLQSHPNHFLSLKPSGYERLDTVRSKSADNRQGFVAMWFGTEMDAAYTDGFSTGVAEAGYRPFRIDKKEHSNKIDDEIIAEIRRSRFVVADFTCPILNLDDGKAAASPRGGVYYEAGFAQGMQIPVIWTVRADCLDHVHFDTRQFAHIVWNETSDLRESLRNRIRAVIG